MERFWRETGHAVRALMRSPRLTLTAILTLAIGIGPTTVLLSAMGGVLLRPLPFRSPEEVVWIWERTPQGRQSTTSIANFLDWRAQSTSFAEMAAYDFLGFDLGGVEQPESVVGAAVSADLFPLLGEQPILGRGFTTEEEQPGRGRVAVLSYRLWQRLFAGDPGALGRKIILDDVPYKVVGVLPKDFWLFLNVLDVFVPLGRDADAFADRSARGFDVIARPRPGVSLAQAQAEMESIARHLSATYPATNDGWGIRVQPVQANYLAYFRPALRVLLIAVGMVLLIACGNVAHLMLARGIGQQREMAVRAALGAGRVALMRQPLVESLLLALVGGAVGVLIAAWSRSALVAVLPGELQQRLPGGVEAIGVDARLMLFIGVLVTAAAVLAGLFPAWQASRSDPAAALKQGGAAVCGRRSRLRNSLVIWQVALACVALVVSVLLLKSLFEMRTAGLGFRPAGVLRVGLSLSRLRYPSASHRTAHYALAQERVSALPGVEAAALTNSLLPPPRALGTPFLIEGRAQTSAADSPTANLRLVSPNYFQLMGIPLLAGRQFSAADAQGAPEVAILSRIVAERYWPRGEAVGQRIRLGTVHDESPWLTVVGVAEDVKHPIDTQAALVIYRPMAQAPTSFASLLVRSAAQPPGFLRSVERALWSLDPQMVLWGVATMEEVLSEELSHTRFATLLAALFAAIGMALAILGVYSANSHAVEQRTREIGIRMALGAQPGGVFRLVMRQAMSVVGLGILAGLIAAGVVVRVPQLASQLHQVSAFDSATFLAVALLMAGAALCGCLLPARRATRVDPMVALRYE